MFIALPVGFFILELRAQYSELRFRYSPWVFIKNTDLHGGLLYLTTKGHKSMNIRYVLLI
jgi:hypothetical protein